MIGLKNSAERLGKVLYDKGISVYKLSRETGVRASTYSNFLNNGNEIGCVKLAKACKYLEVSMDYIMGITEAK